ncbi:hypothetical protein B9Z19DRAFT_1120778 [Tuber borchii]|uniref:Uncharacterized protein n=1 Tax=Tuber borchii TaxID=42251 RepID=A0A2T7A3X1_TUBBO|nr:hypothetical protein B9Z19DRAFT_1120778 [Tuber borchii]
MICQNKNRVNLSPLETAFECARANWGNRLKQRPDFARGYDEYQALNDETKAVVDREIIAEENEILEQVYEAILADWQRYYPNQFGKDNSPLANPPIPIEVDSPPNSPAPSLNPSPNVRPMVRIKSLLDRVVKRPRSSSTGRSFSMHGAAGSPVAASVEPAVGLARAATFGTSRTREPISGRTRFKIRFRRRNPGTNHPEGTHTSPSMPTGREDRTSEYQLTMEDMDGDLDITVQENKLDEKGRPLIDWVKPVEWLLPNAEVYEEWEKDEEDQYVDFIDLYESDEEDGNGSEDSDEIYGEEMIYEEEKKEEEEEMDNDSDNDNDDDYHDDGEREQSSHSLSRSENGDVKMIGAGETSGSSLGRTSRDLDHSHSAPFTRGHYGDAAENRFRANTQEIGERLLEWAMTPKDFFTSSEDQQDPIEHIIPKRKWLFAGNTHLIIDLEAAAREDAEEQGIDLEDIDRIDRKMDRQAVFNLSRQQFSRPIKKEPEN